MASDVEVVRPDTPLSPSPTSTVLATDNVSLRSKTWLHSTGPLGHKQPYAGSDDPQLPGTTSKGEKHEKANEDRWTVKWDGENDPNDPLNTPSWKKWSVPLYPIRPLVAETPPFAQVHDSGARAVVCLRDVLLEHGGRYVYRYGAGSGRLPRGLYPEYQLVRRRSRRGAA